MLDMILAAPSSPRASNRFRCFVSRSSKVSPGSANGSWPSYARLTRFSATYAWVGSPSSVLGQPWPAYTSIQPSSFKVKNATYRSGRMESWLKIKCIMRGTYTVVGWCGRCAVLGP